MSEVLYYAIPFSSCCWSSRLPHYRQLQSDGLVGYTARVGTLARPLEAVLDTPSHQRVHHGANEQCLDRNYGGNVVIWDRLFGSFEPEASACATG